MESPFARRWARLGLYVGVAAAAGVTLYWLLAAGRADWADWHDDPANDARRFASALGFPLSFLSVLVWPALKRFEYWPWMVVLGPPLNGLALGALIGFLRDRAGTRRRFDFTTPRWTTLGLLALAAPAVWAGFTGAIILALLVIYWGPALWRAPPSAQEGLVSLVSVAWLAGPLGLILMKRAVPTARRWSLLILLLGAAVYTVFVLLPRAPRNTWVFTPFLYVLAWLVIGFGACVAAVPAARVHAVPSPDRLRLTRSALRYALLACATPFLMLSPLSLPAIVLLSLQIWSSRRRHGYEPGIPPARLAQWGCAAVGLPLAYAALGPWLGAPGLTFPSLWHPAGVLAQISVLAGVLLVQIGVWEMARALPTNRRSDASPLVQTAALPGAAPAGQSREVPWAGLILAVILFLWSVVASSAGARATPPTQVAQFTAGLLMYLSGRAAAWSATRVFGAAIALLALHRLVLVPLLIAIR